MKTKELPLISVIIPVYKVEKYIYECVESVLNQTYQNLEVILVDDGSPDKCPEICDEYAEKDKRVRVIHKKNGGLSDARNCGIKNAKGEYLTLVDSDDCISEKMIETLYLLCKRKNVLLSQCDFTTDWDIFQNEQGFFKNYILNANQCFENLFGTYSTTFCIACGKLYHISLFEHVSFPIGRIHEDVYTTHLLFEQAKKIVFTKKRLYFYRQREGSIMSVERSKPTWDELIADMTRAKYFKEKGYLNLYGKQLCVCINVLKKQYKKYYRQMSLKRKKQMKKIYRKILFELIKQGHIKLPINYWILGCGSSL